MVIGLNGHPGHTATDRVVLGTRTGADRAQTLRRRTVEETARETVNKVESATATSVQVRMADRQR